MLMVKIIRKINCKYLSLAYLIDASMTARLAPPGSAILLFTSVRQVPRGVQGQPSSELCAADVLRMLRVVSMGLITLSPLVLIVPLVISHVVLRWW